MIYNKLFANIIINLIVIMEKSEMTFNLNLDNLITRNRIKTEKLLVLF
jgi:hypothetical protein